MFRIKINAVVPKRVSSCRLSSSQSHNTGCGYLEPPTASSGSSRTGIHRLHYRKAECGKPVPATCTTHLEFPKHLLIKLH